MEPSRPVARKRLDAALEKILSDGADHPGRYALSDLRRKLAVIAQERRFMLVLFLMQQTLPRPEYELAEATRDLKSNVVRNLHVLVAEGIVIPTRDETTRIVRYSINRDLLKELSDLFRRGPVQ
jgi:uridine kinase